MHESLDAYRGNETILIADDELAVLDFLTKFFTGNGYKVITANDGQDAVDKFKLNNDVKLVLLDVVMPRKDGVATGEAAGQASKMLT